MALLSWTDDVVVKLEKAWQETTLEDSFTLPEGQYGVRVNSVHVEESKNGKNMLVWEFVIEEGIHRGKIIKKFSMMETEENIRFLKRDFLRAGIEPRNRLTKIEDDLPQLIDLSLYITLKNGKKDNYQQVYIDSRNLPF